MLECCRCCTKFKGHYLELAETIGRDKGGFLSVPFIDFDLPVATFRLRRRKVSRVVQPVQCFVDAGERVDVPLRRCIELPVVHSEPRRIVHLFKH